MDCETECSCHVKYQVNWFVSVLLSEFNHKGKGGGVEQELHGPVWLHLGVLQEDGDQVGVAAEGVMPEVHHTGTSGREIFASEELMFK